MKKLISMLLLCTLMFSMAACQKKNSDNSNAETSQKVEGNDASGSTSEEGNSAEATKETVTISHELGTVEIPYDAQRVVVLDLAALDIIDALGVGNRVVAMPKSSSVYYLTSYVENNAIENAGSVKEIDMETIMSTEPDLIIIGGRLQGEYETLSKIAPTLLVGVDHTVGYMETFKENVQNIASIFGLEELSEELMAGFDARVEALCAAVDGKSAIVGLVTSGSFSSLGIDSRCSLISREVGFHNLASNVDSTHGDTSSFELLVDVNPEYIFVLDRDTAINAEGASMAKDVMENELVAKTSAYQKNQIIYLTPDVWYLSEGGITATSIMLNDLETGILVP